MPKKVKIAGRDNQSSLTTVRLNFFQSKEKEKNSVRIQHQDNLKDERNVNYDLNARIARKDQIDDVEVPSQYIANDETLETDVFVGAFAVAGIPGEISDVDERSFQDARFLMTHPSQDAASVTITSARVVDDVIINAIPLEDSQFGHDVPYNTNAVLKKGLVLRYRLIAISSLLLLAGIIIAAVILIRKSRHDAATNAFLEKLRPLLTNTSRQELELPNTVPYLALDWLLYRSNFRAYSFDRQVQRFAMAAFFFSTGGTSWKENSGWLSEDDECSWYQSSNDTLCVNGTLQILSLNHHTLNGLLPSDIALLSSLTFVHLRGNQLAGSIPSSIGALQKLTWLSLADNKLTGTVPSSIGLLTRLMIFDLFSNSFTGTIPLSIETMSNVRHISLAKNDLKGSIPSEIGLCTKLTFLDLWGNSLDGSLPSEIGQCTGLEDLHLWFNSLHGSIPSEISNCLGLEKLDLGFNPLDGSIPSEIGLCTKLMDLDFSSTSLTGSIPTEIGQCTNLTDLALPSNSLKGSIPSEIGQCSKLTTFDLKQNSLLGSIPSEIVALAILEKLDISGNNLSGTIPKSLCNQVADLRYDGNVTCP